MLNTGIPNDSIKLRRKVFSQLMTPDETTGYMDGEDYELLKPFVQDYKPDVETLLWMCFLYGMSYSCTTTLRFLFEFPTLADVNPKLLNLFWKENKKDLWFQPDKKYLKNNDQIVPAIKNMYKVSHKNLSEYLIPLLEKGFDTTYKEIIKNWSFFGPSGAYLFFDGVYGWCPSLYSDPTNLDWKNCGQTVGEGMAHLLGLDEQANHQEPFDVERYNKNVNMLAVRFQAPKIMIESNLCFFRKLFKGTRYLGYYADRQMKECLSTAELVSKHCNGIDMWDYRKRTTPEYLLGECNDWNDIRKYKYKDFLSTGGIL